MIEYIIYALFIVAVGPLCLWLVALIFACVMAIYCKLSDPHVS